jgi:2-methylcitrate dehydratase PrpD
MVALAVVHGDASMRRFSEETIGSRAVQEVVKRITLRADPELEKDFPRKWPSAVEVRTKDGRVLTHSRDLPRGEPEDPFSTHEVEEKFHALASSALGEGPRRELLELIHTLPERDSLTDLFTHLGQRD